ncbi:hypothetical protein KFL_005910090 [Klebsormidium nitens]|uniref:Uncharacterized protein n=1 Tax=Klebsormidium nitens TaxID=105231 RepID=A0A1Y1IGM5_KLENI|nr:hypothetical protein KFL_005910090 [Klebsormidium nitens]|eukprot:GAQ90034.1 hypothetical protein KFL_005910090 [Klebsormidium nitens]
MVATDTAPSSRDAGWIPWDSLQATLADYHWALQEYLRSLVQALHHLEADPSRSAPQRGARSRPFAVLWRWRGLDGLGPRGGRATWERQCWFCDGVGIMPVVNLHGYLCAWAPAALNTRHHAASAAPPSSAAAVRPPAPSHERLQRRRAALARGHAGRVGTPGLRLMRVSKAQKVPGESTQRYVGHLVPAFEVRERAEQMPHWHDGRTRRRGNLLEFDWRRAQWIADVQNIVESPVGPAPPAAAPPPPPPRPLDAAQPAAGALAKAAHLTGGDRRSGGMARLERMLADWSRRRRGAGRRQAGGAERAGEGLPQGGPTAAARTREGQLGGRRSSGARGGTAGQGREGRAGRPAAEERDPAGPRGRMGRGGNGPGRGQRQGEGRGAPVTLDGDFPEDLVSIRPGYEEEEEGAAAAAAVAAGRAGLEGGVTFRDRIFDPRLRASPLLQPMLRISEALSLSFLGERRDARAGPSTPD